MAQTSISRPLRRTLGALLAGALLAPAGAAADTTVIAGPLKIRDYELRLIGIGGDSLGASFTRTAGGSTQMHMLSFSKGVKVTPTSIKGKLGRYGAVNLALTGAKRARGTVPPGCTGKPGTATKGTFTGKLRLVAGDSYFRTVTAKRLPGETSKSGTIDCSDAPDDPADGERKLSLMHEEGGRMTMLEATPKGQFVNVLEDAASTAPAMIVHSIEATGRGLEVGADLGTATVPAVGPFLKGSGSYEGMTLDIGSFGTLGGSLTAAFDMIGDVPLRGDASLQEPGH